MPALPTAAGSVSPAVKQAALGGELQRQPHEEEEEEQQQSWSNALGKIGGEFTSFLSRGQASPAQQPSASSIRAEAASGSAGRGRATPGRAQVHPAPVFLKQWQAAWAAATGFTAEQVRLIGSHVVHGEAMADVSVLVVTYVLQGVEVLVRVTISGLQGWAEGNGTPVILTADGAMTKCRWELAERCVAAANRAAEGQPLEELLAALLSMWHCDRGGTEPPSGCTSPQHSTDVPEGLSPSRSEGSFISSTAASSRPQTSRGTCHEQRDTAGDSFRMWLGSRPPLLRFQHASRGLAWDHPPTKAEKHEILLLQLFSQEAERQAEIDDVRTRVSKAPSATPCRSQSCRNLPRAAAC